MSDERILSQCWICPECHDDHHQGGKCSKASDGPFMPSPDDNSYIAVEFRKLRAENERLKTALSDKLTEALCAKYKEALELIAKDHETAGKMMKFIATEAMGKSK